MSQSASAKRRRARTYADAAIRAAQRDASWDRWGRDLDLLAELLSEADIRAFMESPGTPRQERLDAFERAAGDALGANGRGMLGMLVDRRDLRLAADIARVYRRASDTARSLDRVHVTSATPLSAEAVSELTQQLTEPGRTVRVSTDVDPAVLGGMVVRRGDHLWDFSVRARLQALAGALR